MFDDGLTRDEQTSGEVRCSPCAFFAPVLQQQTTRGISERQKDSLRMFISHHLFLLSGFGEMLFRMTCNKQYKLPLDRAGTTRLPGSGGRLATRSGPLASPAGYPGGLPLPE